MLELIDKKDNFEVIRDQIAAILVAEITNQMTLAEDAGKDPEEWNLKIYTERSNPWENFLNTKDTEPIPVPIVNIWFDNSNFDMKASDVMSRQKSDTIFNIDCYGFGRSANVETGGHTAGDKGAALAVQKAIRLVRNILMAAENTYLQLPRGTIGLRWPQSITSFQPQIDNRTVQNVVGARIAFRVSFNEFSPQYTGEPLEYLAIDFFRAEDGQVYSSELEMTGGLEMTSPLEMTGAFLYFEADYDYTLIEVLEMDGPLEMLGGQEMFGEG